MSGNPQDWLIGPDLFDREKYEGGENSERKVFYVAVTRAKRGLVLSTFEHLKNTVRPSPFLKEAGVEPVEATDDQKFQNLNIEEQAEKTSFKSLTASELLDYHRCPASFRYGNIWSYQPGIAEGLGFGEAMHHVLRNLYREIKEGKDPLERLPAILEEEFFLPFADNATTEELKEVAKEAIEWYVKDNKDSLGNIEELEVKREFMVDPRIIVSNKMDKIITEDGKAEIRDYKTTDISELTKKEGFEQLQLYALALEELGEEVDKVSLVFPLKEATRSLEKDEIDTESTKEWVEESLEGIAKGEFPGKPESNKCSHCDYQEICSFYYKEDKDQ